MRVKQYRGWQYAVWRENGRTMRRSLRTQDPEIAKQRIQDVRRGGAGESIGQIVAGYLADRDRTTSDPGRLRNAWKRLEPFWAGYRPEQVSRELCRKYISERRANGAGNGTILKELRTLRAATRWHDASAPGVYEFPPEPKPKTRALTRDEYKRLLKGCGAPHISLFVILALATGARTTALLQLKWEGVDFERGRIDLGEGAGNKNRAVVPMTDTARAALTAAREAAITEHVIEYAGKPVAAIKTAFRRACERAKLEDVTPHVLRHTAAVWMAEAGVPMSEISQYLGHTDSRLTERVYARYGPEYLKGASRALEV